MGTMDKADVEALIEAAIDDADVQVYTPRHDEDDDHLGAIVVSPAFEDRSLVDRHQLVHDALDGHLTRDIHAIELRTYTPAEFEEEPTATREVPDEHP